MKAAADPPAPILPQRADWHGSLSGRRIPIHARREKVQRELPWLEFRSLHSMMILHTKA